MKTNPVPARRLALAGSLAAAALLLALLFSPTAQAFAQQLIAQIGHLFVSDAPTYAEQYETRINSGEPTATPEASPQPVEWSAPPLLSLAEASAQAGFSAAAFASDPTGFSLVSRAVTLPDSTHAFTQITTVYTAGDANLTLSQTAYAPDAPVQDLPAGDAAVASLEIDGVQYLWIEHLRLSTYVDANNQVAPQYASLLVWEQDGFEYRLQSTPGLTQEEMLTLAGEVGL